MFNRSALIVDVWAWLAPALLLAAASATGCSEDDVDPAGVGRTTGPLFAVMTQLSSAEESLSYFKTIDALEPQEVDLDTAREFTGLADAWMWDGAVFIAELESLTITKYEVVGETLEKVDEIGFQRYGVPDVAFWVNIFISPTKVWLVNGTDEYIAWNPQTMEITGRIPMPELEARDGLRPFGSYTDRSVAVRDGLLYHPFYYTNDDYFEYTKSSSIAVYDVDTDELVRVVEAPCPGLDHAAQDEEGNLYFSAWVFAPGGAALLDQPTSCVAKIARGSEEAEVAFDVKDVTGGLEGGVLRYVGDGKATLAVFDPSHAPPEQEEVPDKVWGNNWRFWTYDFATNKASAPREDDALGWNAGSAYGTTIDDKHYLLLQTEEGGTTIFDVTDPNETEAVFDVEGWTMRLMKVRD